MLLDIKLFNLLKDNGKPKLFCHFSKSFTISKTDNSAILSFNLGSHFFKTDSCPFQPIKQYMCKKLQTH